MNVVKDAQLPSARALHPRKVHAAASKIARLDKGNKFVIQDIKVKAHVDPGKVTDPYLRWCALGNREADTLADQVDK